MEKKYSISDASRQVEVENHVLRYWEEELGLNIHRNSKGHRFYTDRDIKVLRDVKDLKEQGFLLKAIKLIVHDIDNIRKMNPNELYKLREELNQKVQEEEENVEILAGRNNKSEDNEYGQEELELFKEVMEGIYGEEI